LHAKNSQTAVTSQPKSASWQKAVTRFSARALSASLGPTTASATGSASTAASVATSAGCAASGSSL